VTVSATPALSVCGLTKRFGQTLAVCEVDLDVAPGAFIGLVGPSGCGKTTVLRLLAGLETPTSGQILAEGRDLSGVAPAERGMGMVFQSYALFPNMSVAENVAFGLARKTPAAQRRARVEDMLETVGLEGFATRRPHQLSGGQQQRVAIARALAPGPRVLLLDEPLSALDPQIRETLRGELKALQRRLGVTTLMVTHDQSEALAIADQIVVLRAGRVEQIGDPQTVYSRPASPFVAGFVGAMNLLAGRVAGPGQVELADGGGRLGADSSAFATGAPVIVAVRPEAIRLAPAGSGGLAVTVEDLAFAGAYARLTLRLTGGAGLLADLPLAQALGRIGQPVVVVAEPADVRLFPQGAAR
jgi:ABC-type Fe3+/spermidine/putrescine transport system ATPase subunit